MSEPFLGEIRIFAGNFAPRGWALCNGQTPAHLAEHRAVFTPGHAVRRRRDSLPSRFPTCRVWRPCMPVRAPGSPTASQGEVGGTQTVTLLTTQVPQHNHTYTAGSGSRGNVNTVTGQREFRRAVSDQYLRRYHRRHADEPQYAPAPAGQPAARKHAAVPGAEFHHRAGRDFSRPQLTLQGGGPARRPRFTLYRWPAPFRIYRILCSTPPDLETERLIFESTLASFRRTRRRFPNRCSLPAPRFVRCSTPTATAPMGRPTFAMCDFFLHIFSDTWPGTAFQAFIDLAQACMDDPSHADAADRRPVQELRRKPTRKCGNSATAWPRAGKCDVREFQDPAELDRLLREIFASWWEAVQAKP